jgi:hypothetical protein
MRRTIGASNVEPKARSRLAKEMNRLRRRLKLGPEAGLQARLRGIARANSVIAPSEERGAGQTVKVSWPRAMSFSVQRTDGIALMEI